jgi:hypothetical protein
VTLNLDILRTKLPALEKTSEKLDTYSQYLGFSFVDSALVTALDRVLSSIQEMIDLDLYEEDKAELLIKETSRNIFLAKMLLNDTEDLDLKTEAAGDIQLVEMALDESEEKAVVDQVYLRGEAGTADQNLSGSETVSIVKDSQTYTHSDVAMLIGETKDGNSDIGLSLIDIPYFDNKGFWKAVTSTLMSFSVKYGHEYNSDFRFQLSYKAFAESIEDALSIEILEPSNIDQQEKEELSDALADILFDYFAHNKEFASFWASFIEQKDLNEDQFQFHFQSIRQKEEVQA